MKVGIVGCGGRMGRMLVREVIKNKNTSLIGGVERSGDVLIGKDIGLLVGNDKMDVKIGNDSDNLFKTADVIIDFTTAAASLLHVELAAKHNTSLILGTTGFEESQIQKIKDCATKAIIVHSANFSIGVNLLLGLTEKAASTLKSEYDIEVVEMHHRHKVDAPSGTALAIGEAAAKGRGIDLGKNSIRERNGITGPRKTKTIGFATLRGGAVVGEHTVMFVADGERFELTHKAIDRSIFAVGAVRAAIWTQNIKPGYYSMNNVLGFN